MRRVVYSGALVTAMALAAVPVSAQTPDSVMTGHTGPGAWHATVNIGPTFGTTGTSVASQGSLGVEFGNGLALVGEAGTFRGEPVERRPVGPMSATLPAAPSFGKSNAYHYNANLYYTAPEMNGLRPYLTAGVGAFRSATYTLGTPGPVGLSGLDRSTHAATNFGAGVMWRFNRWLGATADYRTFVFNTNVAPKVHRFNAGISIMLR